MKKRTAYPVWLMICLLPSIAYPDGRRVYTSAKNSVTYIQSTSISGEMLSGSGVIISRDQIATNCHVVEKANQIKVTFSDDRESPGAIKGRVGNFDLCIISANTANRPSAKAARISEIQIGQPVFAIGNPLSLKATISEGVVSAVRQTESGRILQVTTPISPGSSGGGLFDDKGRLIGLTTFTLTKGQNLNFAIPIEYLDVLGLSTIKEVPQELTFKGLPFSTPKKELQALFPGTTCGDKAIEGFSICGGGPIDYLGLRGVFRALYQDDSLHSVEVIIPSSKPIESARVLEAEIIKRFGSPVSTKWDTNYDGIRAEWNIGNASVSISTCKSIDKGILSVCQYVGASVELVRGALKTTKGPSRDF